MTRDEAVAVYDSKWWLTMTPAEAARRQLSERLPIMPFGVFHEGVEALLGRSVWTHEFADAAALIRELDTVGGAS